jgi:hypothetical protein
MDHAFRIEVKEALVRRSHVEAAVGKRWLLGGCEAKVDLELFNRGKPPALFNLSR